MLPLATNHWQADVDLMKVNVFVCIFWFYLGWLCGADLRHQLRPGPTAGTAAQTGQEVSSCLWHLPLWLGERPSYHQWEQRFSACTSVFKYVLNWTNLVLSLVFLSSGTGFDEEAALIGAGREFALMKTASGKVDIPLCIPQCLCVSV